MILVAAPAADPATSHLAKVGSSKFLSMNLPTMIQHCILKAFSGIIPNVRDTTPTERQEVTSLNPQLEHNPNTSCRKKLHNKVLDSVFLAHLENM